uniref:G-protein coupled receptors family 1 profile domain-containing protein n=1 Tax=Panagrolaimus davidi TaxID=227884 RepID=A0A914RD14_9BILA
MLEITQNSPTIKLDEIQSIEIYVATILESCLNVYNILSCIYLISKLKSTRLMHLNLKTMLISVSVTLILFNVFRFIKSFAYFFTQAQSTVTSQLIITISNHLCVVNRFFYDSTVNVLSLTILGILLERTFATFFVRIYEKTDSSIVSRTIVIIQWIIGIIVAIAFLYMDLLKHNYWNNNRMLISCSLVYTHPEIVLTLFTSSVILFCTFTFISILLYYYNRQQFLRSNIQKLAIRYQYKENVTTLTFLVPLSTAFGLSNIVSAFLIAFMFTHIQNEGVNDQLVDNLWKIEKAYNATISVFTVFFVLICIKMHQPLWQIVVSDFRKFRSPSSSVHHFLQPKHHQSIRLMTRKGECVEALNEGDVYFKNLRDTWGK